MHVLSSRNVAAFLASVTAAGWTVWYYLDFFSFGPWPVIILTAASVVAGVWWLRDLAQERRHSDEMADFAALHGWSYAAAGGRWSQKLGRYPFGQGNYRRDTAILSGTFEGLECATFVHEFEHRTEDRPSAPQVFQVTTVALPFPLDTLDVVPEDAAAKALKSLGGQDIQFESAAFNARWRVKASNPKFAHDVLHPRMLERLNQFDAAGLAIRIEGDTLLCWQAGRQPLDGFTQRLRVLCGVAKQIPEHVYREYAEAHEANSAAAQFDETAGPEWARTPGRLTDGVFNPELLEARANEKLPQVDSGAKLSTSVDSYFPSGFFFGGGFDGMGGDA